MRFGASSVRTALPFCIAALLAGCAVGPDYRRPEIELPARFQDAKEAPAAVIDAEWWKLYGDARLNEMVEGALARNTDVRIAIARIEEADAQLREAGAAFLPEIDLGASGSRQRFSSTTATPVFPGIPMIRNNVRLALSTAFEIDFWGRLRRTLEAARAQAVGTRYAKDVVTLTVAGLATQSYFALRSLDAQIELTRSTLESRQAALDLVRRRAEGGIASGLEVSQTESARADAAIQLRELARQRALVEHQLGALTGRLDAAVPRKADLLAMPLPPLPPAGLPSDLLQRRPDIQQAEQQLVAANAAIGVARAAMFPSLSLTGALGDESKAFSTLLDSGSRIWSFGFGLTLPIFDWGRIGARVDAAQAREHQLVAAYQKSIETAFREVADALTSSQMSADAEEDLRVRADAARNSFKLAQLRYEAGYSAYLEVLDAQRTLNEADLAVVRNRQARLAASVDLMKALGGGWKP
jgi:multidrug efflux system outer membrane protein